MKIFINVGAHHGDVAVKFIKDNPNFKLYLFECDRDNIKMLKNRGFNPIEKAAWSSNGKIKYYYGKSDGGTLYAGKKTGSINPRRYYEVESIDMAEFMKDNFSKDDYIVMKMNCEGSEYEIIPHLKKHNLLGWVDKWIVDWHWKKIGMDEDQHNRIKEMV